ncbi:MAG: hypothetical protein FJ318_10515 [SAR202 cluster bacterium]|nr:hypothetical protein [SAR202 cluster bacterium]
MERFVRITSPADQSIVPSRVIVRGVASPGTLVRVNGVEADTRPEGDFVAVVALERGPNLLRATVIDAAGTVVYTDIRVYYFP